MIKSIITIIVLFCQSIFFLSQSSISAQNNLTEEINKIALKENLRLAYESGILQNKFCKISLKGVPIKIALDLLLSQTDLEYVITEDKQLLLRKKEYNDTNSLKLVGQIREKFDNKNISFAAVSLLGSPIGCYSDENGFFDLIIPSDYIKGNDTIIIHRMGYKDKKLELHSFIGNSDIELEVKTRILPVIMILKPIKPMEINTSLINYKIDNEQYEFSSFITEDVLRKVQFLPSVYANNDKSSKINFRGSKSFETLVILDGLRIYNPTHFYNVFSSINNDFVKEVNVYKNTIPPSIRSMTGGIVKMSSYDNIKTFLADFDANLMYLSANAVIPVSNKFKINIAIRKSVFEKTKKSILYEVTSKNNQVLQDSNLLNSKSPGFMFYDFNNTFLYKINKKQEIKLSFYKSMDLYDDSYIISLKNKENNITNIGLKYIDISDWNNLGIGLNYSVKWLNVDTDISISSAQYQEKNILKINIKRQRPDSIQVKSIFDSKSSSINDVVFKIDNKIKVNTYSKILFGIDLTNYNVLSNIDIKQNSILNLKEKSNTYTVYGGFYGKLNNIDFGLALKSTYLSSTKTNYFCPSFDLVYHFSKNSSLFGSISKQHQYLRQFEYETPQSKNTYVWALASNSTPVLTSNNISIGSKLTYAKSTITIEAFHKTLNGLSTLLRPAPTSRNDHGMVNENYKIFYGDSYNYGLDILWLQKIKNYSSQLSYTYSILNQRFNQVFKNRYHPAPNDTRHQIKWINSYTWNNWRLGLNFIYSSGTPYFDFSNLTKDSHRSKIVFENFIEYLPDYFRSDFSINYKLNFFKKNMIFGLTVFNLSDRVNISERRIINTGRGFNPKNTPGLIRSQTNLLSRTINIGIKLKI